MFGKKKDFFGTQYIRYKSLMDIDKQRKLEDVKAQMAEQNQNIDLQEIYLEKQKCFDNVINQRTIMSQREVTHNRLERHYGHNHFDLMHEVVKNFFHHDRLDAIERLIPAMSPSLKQWTLDQINQRQAAKQAVVSTPTPDPQENEAQVPTDTDDVDLSQEQENSEEPI